MSNVVELHLRERRRTPDAAAWLTMAMCVPMIAAMLPVVMLGAVARAWLAMDDEWQCRAIREKHNANTH